jgi:chromatin remodeling complex protein RSC6
MSNSKNSLKPESNSSNKRKSSRKKDKSKVRSGNKKRDLPPRPKAVVRTQEENVNLKVKKEKVKDLTPKPRASKRKPDIKGRVEDHVLKYNQLFELLDAEIERKSREKEKGVRSLQKVRKSLKNMRKEVPYITRSKEGRKIASTRKHSTGGLEMKYHISEDLRNFLQLGPKDTITRLDATRAICVYARLKKGEDREPTLKWAYLNPNGKRDLQNKDNKIAIVPDKALSKLLDYKRYQRDVAKGKITKKVKDKTTGESSKQKVKDDDLYYWVIQKLITPHFLEAEVTLVKKNQG